VEDMCYERRRAEDCVDESAHHALANAGGRKIVGKKEGEQKGSARVGRLWERRRGSRRGVTHWHTLSARTGNFEPRARVTVTVL
jgi:hypothetical protein